MEGGGEFQWRAQHRHEQGRQTAGWAGSKANSKLAAKKDLTGVSIELRSARLAGALRSARGGSSAPNCCGHRGGRPGRRRCNSRAAVRPKTPKTQPGHYANRPAD